MAVYSVLRAIDDAGDAVERTPQQRLAALDRLTADLRGLWTGAAPADPVVRALAPAVAECGLTPAPFLALVEANRLDQSVPRWETWTDLRHYCSLSANPVGHLVLAVFGAPDSPALRAASDDVCTALQVLEHCQDVGEDLRLRDRVYLPADELAAAGVDISELRADSTTPALRSVVRRETERARDLLASGTGLVAALDGWTRLAVAGYVAGGLATVDALQRASYDVLAGAVTPRRRDVIRHLIRLVRAR